jgi:hypothetical protein
MRQRENHGRAWTRFRKAVIRSQLLILLLLSSTSGLLAEQLWDRTDRLSSEYRALSDEATG